MRTLPSGESVDQDERRGPVRLAAGPPERLTRGMPSERPPVTDAEYRVVRGPWPRWMLHLSLIKLLLFAAAAAGVCIAAALAIVGAVWALD